MLKNRSGSFPLRSRLAVLAVASALCAAPSLAQQDPAAEPPPPVAEVHKGPPEAVIAPGQEELLATMLGKGGDLPQGCTLSNGNIQHKVVEASYTCPGGEVVFELTHPDQAGSGAKKTDKFALRLKSGTPPDGFVDALAARIHSQEAAFKWTMLGGTATASRTPILVTAAVAVAAIALVVWLRRSRSRRPATP